MNQKVINQYEVVSIPVSTEHMRENELKSINRKRKLSSRRHSGREDVSAHIADTYSLLFSVLRNRHRSLGALGAHVAATVSAVVFA